MKIIILLIYFQIDFIFCNEIQQRNSFEISTCCSSNFNDKIFLSCSSNEFIQLNLIEIYSNSNLTCSFESSSCCQMKSSCSRRLTKYYHSICHQKQFCFIDKYCVQIYSSSCSNPNGLNGQFLFINYSCLTNDPIEEELSPIIVKLSTSDQIKEEKQIEYKSSPRILLFLIFIFLILMLIIYYFADYIGKRFCREKDSSKVLSNHLIYLNKFNEKLHVESTIPKTRIYPKEKCSYSRYQTLINVQHDPITGQVISTTFYPHFNSYYQS